MNALHRPRPQTVSGWEMTMLVLSVYVLCALFVEVAFRLPPELVDLLHTSDHLICVAFLGDFFFRLVRAENKLAFLKWHWIDFVSSIPAFGFLRVGRAVQVVRVLRVLRAVRSGKIILTMVFRNRVHGAAASLILLAVLLIMSSAIGVMICERVPGTKIHNGNDALWWAITTVTSVGYGDTYPITTAGRIIGTVLMIGGIALAGTFTACVASVMLEPERQKEQKLDLLIAEVRLLRERVESLMRDQSK